jgi:hypothetical protein
MLGVLSDNMIALLAQQHQSTAVHGVSSAGHCKQLRAVVAEHALCSFRVSGRKPGGIAAVAAIASQ